MLRSEQSIAIFMEGAIGEPFGKMGYGVLRYSPNPIACVVDSNNAGQDARDVTGIPRSAPIVATVDEARGLGAEVFLLGIAPGGGLIPEAWWGPIDRAVELGMSVVNGLHDRLAPRYPNLSPGQWIWDIRVEPEGLGVGTGAARKLPNRRLLMLGTDMAVGKMTAGLELHRRARERGVKAEFVATGQIGMTIMGSGVPLDAIRVDYAAGAIEREVMRAAGSDLVIVEGQGSIIHPSSTSTIPLIRGTCATHLILCHRAGQESLMRHAWVRIPPLLSVARLYEDITEACGVFRRPKTVGIALNTFHIKSDAEALRYVDQAKNETGLPVTDPVRFGVDALLDPVLSA